LTSPSPPDKLSSNPYLPALRRALIDGGKMVKTIRLLPTALAFAALVASLFIGAVSAGATSPPVHVIGVDNATPSGHNFEYVDFFPHAATTVHLGDVIDFAWNAGSPDGFHTATLLKPGESVAAAYAAPENQLAIPDEDATAHLQLNPSIVAPTKPACGHTVTSPCNYSLDSNSRLNSGAMPTAPGGHFFVTTSRDGDVSAPTTINFICLIHHGMVGSFTIVPLASETTSSSEETAAATAQYATETAGALTAETAADQKSVTNNGDGTHTITMTAGTASPGVEVLEMLPRRVEVRPGDKVKWVTTTRADIHTVTFPRGPGSNSVDPIPFACEVTGDTDAPSTGGPPNFGCSGPAAVENHLIPQAQGPTAIASTSTVATSGIIASGPPQFPTNYTFSFPNSGTFAYQCRIHDNMVGTIVVNPAENPTPPVLPQTGAGSPWRALPFLLGALALLFGLAMLRWRSLLRP
jgi:plastocyanin